MANKKTKTSASRTGKSAKSKKTSKKSKEPTGVTYIVSVTVCILLMIFTYTNAGGTLGTAVQDFLFGLFGKCAYFMPVAALGCVVYLFYSNNANRFLSKSVLTFFLLWDLSAIIHITSGSVYDIPTSYAMGTVEGGGFFGACIGYPLHTVAGTVVPVIMLIAAGIIIISIITQISIVSGIISMVAGFVEDFNTVEEIDNSDTGRKISQNVKSTTRKIRETKDEINENIQYIKNESRRVIDFKINENEAVQRRTPAEILKEQENVRDDIKKPDKLSVSSLNNRNDSKPLLKEKMEKIYGKKTPPPAETIPAVPDRTDTAEEVQTDETFAPEVKENNNNSDALFSFIDPETGEIISAQEIEQNDIKYQDSLEDYSEYYTDDDYFEEEPEKETGIENTIFNTIQEEPKKEPVDEFIRVTNTEPKEKISKTYVEKEPSVLSVRNEEQMQYIYPDIGLLNTAKVPSGNLNEEMRTTAMRLIETLKNFHINVRLSEVTQGPSVTRYEIQPEVGIKLSKIVNLSDDLAMNLAVSNILIAPVPGKPVIGIEVPNKSINMVTIRELIDSEEFRHMKSKLAFVVGRDIGGRIITADIAKMPHLLIAGSTGSGKSVFINTLITSILYNASPDEVKLIMVDPKVVELGVYNGIPHLMIPVVTDPKKAAGALSWAVQEMMKRYDLFAKNKVRNLSGYNKLASGGEIEKLPQILIIIDELADLMMVAAKEVEGYICRLAQLARAAGIHLVIATQRPSVDVITGLIKANIPSRAALFVSSQVDSRTILGKGGAEKLLGNGDMLFHPAGLPNAMRIQGAYISDEEIENVVKFLIENSGESTYEEDLAEHIEKCAAGEDSMPDTEDDGDELLPQAIRIAIEAGQISTSMVQRRLGVGYARAGRIVDQMEARGIISGANGSKPREVLLTAAEMYGDNLY